MLLASKIKSLIMVVPKAITAIGGAVAKYKTLSIKGKTIAVVGSVGASVVFTVLVDKFGAADVMRGVDMAVMALDQIIPLIN